MNLKSHFYEMENKLFYYSVIIQTSQSKGKFCNFFSQDSVPQIRMMHKNHAKCAILSKSILKQNTIGDLFRYN